MRSHSPGKWSLSLISARMPGSWWWGQPWPRGTPRSAAGRRKPRGSRPRLWFLWSRRTLVSRHQWPPLSLQRARSPRPSGTRREHRSRGNICPPVARWWQLWMTEFLSGANQRWSPGVLETPGGFPGPLSTGMSSCNTWEPGSGSGKG